jgi:hypothetical protein
MCLLPDGVELMIIIVATFGQAVSANGHAIKIIGVLVVWRFVVCGCLLCHHLVANI